jgi:hypothetical protein
MTNEPMITYTLKPEHAQFILAVVAKLSIEQAGGLYADLMNQFNEQAEIINAEALIKAQESKKKKTDTPTL